MYVYTWQCVSVSVCGRFVARVATRHLTLLPKAGSSNIARGFPRIVASPSSSSCLSSFAFIEFGQTWHSSPGVHNCWIHLFLKRFRIFLLPHSIGCKVKYIRNSVVPTTSSTTRTTSQTTTAKYRATIHFENNLNCIEQKPNWSDRILIIAMTIFKSRK